MELKVPLYDVQEGILWCIRDVSKEWEVEDLRIILELLSGAEQGGSGRDD